MTKLKYILAGLVILAALALLVISRLPGEEASTAGRISLSYDICLSAGAGYRAMDEDTARLAYMRQYWADSSSQFFSKTLLSPEGDTLFISVFNNASLKKAQELLLAAGFETLLAERAQAAGNSAISILARSADGRFFLRRLIGSARHKTVTMADLPGADSTGLQQKFHSGAFLKIVEKCL